MTLKKHFHSRQAINLRARLIIEQHRSQTSCLYRQQHTAAADRFGLFISIAEKYRISSVLHPYGIHDRYITAERKGYSETVSRCIRGGDEIHAYRLRQSGHDTACIGQNVFQQSLTLSAALTGISGLRIWGLSDKSRSISAPYLHA